VGEADAGGRVAAFERRWRFVEALDAQLPAVEQIALPIGASVGDGVAHSTQDVRVDARWSEAAGDPAHQTRPPRPT